MQTNLSDIKQLLTDWYLLTLENPLYAGALVLSAWLLTVFFYSIRLSFIKKQQRKSEEEGIKLKNQLDEALLESKQSGDKLAAMAEQLAKEQQHSTEFSLKVEERNQNIVKNIKHLAGQFDLSEQLVASGEKPKAEFVWQQQDNIQLQLTERLQAAHQEKNTLQETYNQEKEQFSKQNAIVGQLQRTLDLQTSKAAQLEQDLSVQKRLQQQLKTEAEQILADKLAAQQLKHDQGVAALGAEPDKQSEPLDVNSAVQSEFPSASMTDQVSQIAVETIQPDVNALAESLVTHIEEPDLVVKDSDLVVPEQEDVAVSPVTDNEQEEIEPDYAKSNLDITGKFKSMFAKSNKPVDKLEQPIVQSEEVPVSKVPISEAEEEPDYSKSKLDISGKFKGLFAKEKKQIEEKVAEELLPEIEKELNDKKTDSEVTGKFTKLFAKESQKVEPIASEPLVEAVISDEQEPEEIAFEPDYGKSNFHMPGKLKKLFGKS